ncbi:MAG: orotidine 5'-phosphate decarboxylase / HUMPS family protein [Candidatus Heimdallarchaeaceae archaeon]
MKLDNSPYVQVALDIIDYEFFQAVLSKLPESPKLLIEAGTPLIKKFGAKVLNEIRSHFNDSYIIADMKTLDVGGLEVQIGAEDGANAVAVSGLAPIETIESAIKEGKERSVDIILDLMNVQEPLALLKQLSDLPAIVLFHRGIDQEGRKEHPWELIQTISQTYPDVLIAVAGGLDLATSKKALENGAQIIIIGRAITQAPDVHETTLDFLKLVE